APVPPGWTREATGPGGATEPAQPAGMTLTGAPLAAEGPAETAPDGGPSRRRPNVLLGVLTIVVVTGAAFVALSLFMPRVPEPERVEVAPAAPGDAPSTAARDAAGEQALAGPAGSVPSPPDAGGTAAARPTSGAAPAATPPPTPPRLPRERPGGTSAGAGSGAAGDARAPAEPVAAPPEPIPAPVSEAAGPMEVHIKATGRTWVQLFCDSDEAINWVMRRGETRRLQCLRSIRVSATDAAAVRLRVNGEPCLPLGEPGSRVYGYTIRFDDYRQICPPEREAHARP
ncbi:MAG: RodZ domain-containing protein, partial [Acidobacteriota bacterium]